MTLSNERLEEILGDETYVMVMSSEIMEIARELRERRERDKQEPVAYTSSDALADVYCGDTAMMGPADTVGDVALYAAPVVPEEWTWDQAKAFIRAREIQFPVEAAHEAVKAYRAAMIAAAPKQDKK